MALLTCEDQVLDGPASGGEGSKGPSRGERAPRVEIGSTISRKIRSRLCCTPRAPPLQMGAEEEVPGEALDLVCLIAAEMIGVPRPYENAHTPKIPIGPYCRPMPRVLGGRVFK